MGHPDCSTLFESDNEMSRRFKYQFTLQSLNVGTKANPGHLIPFLEQVAFQILKRTDLHSLPPIHEYSNAFQIFAATGGNIDYVMTLIKQAVIKALLNQRRDVTREDLAEAWDSGICSGICRTHRNPFRMEPGELASAFREKRL
jgi:hypothetical protein